MTKLALIIRKHDRIYRNVTQVEVNYRIKRLLENEESLSLGERDLLEKLKGCDEYNYRQETVDGKKNSQFPSLATNVRRTTR